MKHLTAGLYLCYRQYKVIEKVIHSQTSTFVNYKNLLYNYQSGFCKNHPIDFCLSFLNNKILKGFNQGLMND